MVCTNHSLFEDQDPHFFFVSRSDGVEWSLVAHQVDPFLEAGNPSMQKSINGHY